METKSTTIWKESLARKGLLIVIMSWVILATVFGFLDLQISILVVDKQAIWAQFIADYGEIPGMIVILSSILILDRNRQTVGWRKNILISLMVLSILTLMMFYWFDIIAIKKNDFLKSYRYFFLPVIGILLFSIQQFLKKIDSKHFTQIDKMSRITLILAIINPLLFVQIVKITWGRVRFRDLTPDFSNFTSWFIPQGITGGSSFPSGHTAMGWMLLPLILLTLDKQSRTQLLFLTPVIGWGVIVAAGRVVIGAHYASDVLFSSCFAFVSFLLLYKHYYFQHEFKKD